MVLCNIWGEEYAEEDEDEVGERGEEHDSRVEPGLEDMALTKSTGPGPCALT